MKRILLILSLIGVLYSCGSETNESTPTDPIIAKWQPEKLVPVIQVVGEISSMEFVYPHKANCDKDYIEFLENNISKTFQHQDDCSVTFTEQTWSKNENTITFTMLGTEIQGTIITLNDNEFVIQSDVSQYASLIAEYYPEIGIPQQAKINLYLNK